MIGPVLLATWRRRLLIVAALLFLAGAATCAYSLPKPEAVEAERSGQ